MNDTGHRYGPRAGRISEPQAVGLLRSMLEIPSPSCHEAELAASLVESMRALGFTTRIDAVGNVIGEIDRGRGPTVMLLGHMDTIPGDLPVRSSGDRLYGRGAVDAKGPLAAMICAAAGAQVRGGRIVVVGAVQEETPSSAGAMEIRRTLPKPDALVIGEPSGWSTVVIGYKGKLDLHYRAECAPTHPSNPVPKATEMVTRCWNTVTELLGPEAGHATFDRPGATLVSLAGDLTTATAEISVRVPVGFDTTGFVDALRAGLAVNGPGVSELTVLNSVAACRTNRSDPVVRALFAAVRDRQVQPRAKLKTATSDMNTLAEVWDVPMATYGPGDSTLDHADDEHIALADYFAAIDVLSAALCELCASLGPGAATPLRRPALAQFSQGRKP